MQLRSDTRPTFVVGAHGTRAAEAAARFTARLAEALGVAVLRASVPDTASAADDLRAVVDGHGAELLAVGGTHRYGVGRVPPAGVADRLLAGAPWPVLVVPPEYRDRTVRAVGVAAGPGSRTPAALADRLAGALAARVEQVGDGTGRPAPHLIRASAGLDLLLVAAGETARQVVAHADCPVLVTP